MSKTYAQLKAKIEMDMDTEDEDFVQDTELMEYFNDAIRDCEGDIHKLGLENYFENSDNPAVISGTSEYSMPSDIYLNKIKRCIYSDGTNIYEIKELTGEHRYQELAYDASQASGSRIYRYILKNASSSGVKWKLTPTPTETSSTRFTRYYIRAATKMATTASICDLPEACYNFIYAYVAWRIWAKEGDLRADGAKQEVELQRQMMVDRLADMTPDDNNRIEMDTSAYDDMS